MVILLCHVSDPEIIEGLLSLTYTTIIAILYEALSVESTAV